MKCKIFYLVCILFPFTGCKQELRPAEYLEELKSHSGYYKTSSSDDLEYAARYKPVESIVLMEAEDELTGKEEFEERKKELEGFHYFDFRISTKKKTDNRMKNFRIRDQELIYYFSHKIENDFSLMAGIDTLHPVNCHFEKSLSGDFRFVMYFPEGKNEEDITLIYNDRITGYGPLMFRFKKETINHSPTLIFP